ncbi:MAG TPA: hypothetical protein VF017_05075 [Thermoanaerobaculia bacterium]|nr:hypothetical protein [Thermoanaerobaculia bacterium]
MKLNTRVRVEEKYDSPAVVVAPGGWCCCTCCHSWCHCHVSNVMASSGDEEL